MSAASAARSGADDLNQGTAALVPSRASFIDIQKALPSLQQTRPWLKEEEEPPVCGPLLDGPAYDWLELDVRCPFRSAATPGGLHYYCQQTSCC